MLHGDVVVARIEQYFLVLELLERFYVGDIVAEDFFLVRFEFLRSKLKSQIHVTYHLIR